MWTPLGFSSSKRHLHTQLIGFTCSAVQIHNVTTCHPRPKTVCRLCCHQRNTSGPRNRIWLQWKKKGHPWCKPLAKIMSWYDDDDDNDENDFADVSNKMLVPYFFCLVVIPWIIYTCNKNEFCDNKYLNTFLFLSFLFDRISHAIQ